MIAGLNDTIDEVSYINQSLCIKKLERFDLNNIVIEDSKYYTKTVTITKSYSARRCSICQHIEAINPTRLNKHTRICWMSVINAHWIPVIGYKSFKTRKCNGCDKHHQRKNKMFLHLRKCLNLMDSRKF